MAQPTVTATDRDPYSPLDAGSRNQRRRDKRPRFPRVAAVAAKTILRHTIGTQPSVGVPGADGYERRAHAPSLGRFRSLGAVSPAKRQRR
jgi:hypothetical protein